MKKMTEENLKSAFAGESQAHLKYIVFSEKAEKEGLKNVARLFKAISFAEKIHAGVHLRNLGGIKSTAENLDTAIAGETFEVEEMYPAYKAVAELQNEKTALRGIDWALGTEIEHNNLYQNAKEVVATGKDIEEKDIYVCELCGFTVAGEAPDECPLCKAKKDKFKKF